MDFGLPNKQSMECENWDFVVFGGLRARVTLGYLPFEIASSVRNVFEAASKLLPVGSYFTTGARINYSVLPVTSAKKSHSYVLDIKDTSPAVTQRMFVSEV
eukprot:11162932-Lingulodinium_polyedra.AAC.1